METLVVVIPYSRDTMIAKFPRIMGPFKVKLGGDTLARIVREKYGDNLHWQVEAICDWSKVIPHIKTALEGSIKGRKLDDGVVAAIEVLLKTIIEWETSKQVEVNKKDDIKIIYPDGRGSDN